MGRGRKGITEQSRRKPKRTDVQRGKPIAVASVKNRETKKIPVPEHVVDFMKDMNPYGRPFVSIFAKSNSLSLN